MLFAPHLWSVMLFFVVDEPIRKIGVVVPAETVVRRVNHLLRTMLAEHHGAEGELPGTILVVIRLLWVPSKKPGRQEGSGSHARDRIRATIKFMI